MHKQTSQPILLPNIFPLRFLPNSSFPQPTPPITITTHHQPLFCPARQPPLARSFFLSPAFSGSNSPRWGLPRRSRQPFRIPVTFAYGLFNSPTLVLIPHWESTTLASPSGSFSAAFAAVRGSRQPSHAGTNTPLGVANFCVPLDLFLLPAAGRNVLRWG